MTTNADQTGLPVAGYRPQAEAAIGLVNMSKLAEEGVLRILDGLERVEGVDRRWLAIARTQIEQGFMAANHAVFRPQRLTEDEFTRLNEALG